MTPLAYNTSIGAGLASIGAGTALVFGPGWALIVAGALVIALTLVAALLQR